MAFTSGLILLEIIFGGLIEVILDGCLYWVGYLILWTASLGQLCMAPFSTYGDENWKSKWYHLDWSIWLKRPGHAAALRAEMVCLAGLCAVLAGLLIFGISRELSKSTSPPVPASQVTQSTFGSHEPVLICRTWLPPSDCQLPQTATKEANISSHIPIIKISLLSR